MAAARAGRRVWGGIGVSPTMCQSVQRGLLLKRKMPGKGSGAGRRLEKGSVPFVSICFDCLGRRSALLDVGIEPSKRRGVSHVRFTRCSPQRGQRSTVKSLPCLTSKRPAVSTCHL